MHDLIHESIVKKFKLILGEGLLYISNQILSRIPFHFIRLFFYRYCLGLEIDEGSHIFMNAWFDTRRQFKMGKNSVINQKCRLDNRGEICIGNNVSISAEVCILTADHNLKCNNFPGRHGAVKIEDYVFIGTRATIMPGVTLKKGCAVGAGAVVTKDVPPYTIVAGIPSKPIGKRPENLDYSCNYPRLFH